MNDRRNRVSVFIVALLLVFGCGSSNTVMIGISGSYVEVADGDSTQITVPRRDTDLPLYFSVKCPDGYASCTVLLDNPPVEAKVGETARLTGRLEYRGETMYRFDTGSTSSRSRSMTLDSTRPPGERAGVGEEGEPTETQKFRSGRLAPLRRHCKLTA